MNLLRYKNILAHGGSAVLLGTFGGSHRSILPQDDGLILVQGHMGFERITRVRLRDGELLVELVSERQLSAEEEYAYTGQEHIPNAPIEGDSLLR